MSDQAEIYDDLDEHYRNIHAAFHAGEAFSRYNVGSANSKPDRSYCVSQADQERLFADQERLFAELDELQADVGDDDLGPALAPIPPANPAGLDHANDNAEPVSGIEQLLGLVGKAKRKYRPYEKHKHTVIIPPDATPSERRRLLRNERERNNRAKKNGGNVRRWTADRKTMTPEQQKVHDQALNTANKRKSRARD